MGKRKYYFPPKTEKKPITISDDVKEELKKLADKYADDAIKERQTEDLDNYIAFTLEALRRLGWNGKAFIKNDDATPQLEDHVERNDDK